MTYFIIKNRITRDYQNKKRALRIPGYLYNRYVYFAMIVGVGVAALMVLLNGEASIAALTSAMVVLAWVTIYAVSPPPTDALSDHGRKAPEVSIAMAFLLMCHLFGVFTIISRLPLF